MSDSAKDEFIKTHVMEDFKEGLKLENMLKPVRMPGGIVLENKGYKMTKKFPLLISKSPGR